MPTSEIQAGMTGYGKTVWEGNRIERFHVTIMGVLKNFELKRDLILARISGPTIEKAGVVAGMSGSPVYIENRLIGALSSAWPFQKEAIAGITPIGDMIDLLDLPAKPGTAAPPVSHTPKTPDGPPAYGLAQIRTPIMLGGVPQNTLRRLQSRYEALGFVPVQSGGPSGTAAINPEVTVPEPGSAVGVVLISGDMSVDAVGTVTYRDEDRFVAFGHTFMDLGPTQLPVAPAYVYGVMPSLYVSFKIAASGAPIGILENDRSPGIVGRLGPKPRQFPFHVEIAPDGHEKFKSYDFKVSQVGNLTPLLLLTALDSILTTNGRASGEQSFATHLELKLKGRPLISTNNLYSNREDHVAGLTDLIIPIVHILNNRFEPVEVESFSVKMQAVETLRDAHLEWVRLDRQDFERGEEVEVAAFLKPVGKDREAVRLRVKIPADAPLGTAQLHVSEAGPARLRAAQHSPGHYIPSSLSAQIALYQEERHNNDVVLQLFFPKEGLVYAGTELPRLPGSALSVLTGSGLSGYRALQRELETRQTTAYAIHGDEVIDIRIREHKKP
jgi:hypothetical protein